jgi:hypothetical protein
MAEQSFEGWAILELMGHRRLGGYVTEQQVGGVAFVRIDVPEHPWVDGCTCGSDAPASASHEDHTHVCQMFRDEGDDRPLDVHATQLYNPSAVYCLTPTGERVARGAAQTAKPTPVARWELEPPREAARVIAGDVVHDDEEPDF